MELLDQIHDLVCGQGGKFITMFIFEPLVYLLPVRGHGFDEDAVFAGLNDQFGIGLETKLFTDDLGDGNLS